MIYIIVSLIVLIFFTVFNVIFIKKHKDDKKRSVEIKLAYVGIIIFLILIGFLISRALIGVS